MGRLAAPITNSSAGSSAGWLCAFNEGGSFSPEVSLERFPAVGPIPRLIGANLFGDDRMELIVGFGSFTRHIGAFISRLVGGATYRG